MAGIRSQRIGSLLHRIRCNAFPHLVQRCYERELSGRLSRWSRWMGTHWIALWSRQQWFASSLAAGQNSTFNWPGIHGRGGNRFEIRANNIELVVVFVRNLVRRWLFEFLVFGSNAR